MSTMFSVALRLFITVFSVLSPSQADDYGFTVDLIHRDSPASPFHNPSLTSFEHLRNCFKRSHDRTNHFKSIAKKSDSVYSKVIPSSGAYMMEITLGTPTFNFFAIADTGSDLTWTQCEPCPHCYKQKAPLFNPKKSSTYKEFPCNSRTCRSLTSQNCSVGGTCQYSVFYGDGSYTKGTLASEKLTFSSIKHRPISFPKIIFGCGSQSGGLFNDDGSGLVGLGGGSESLIAQLNSTINGRFSYCLVPMFSDKKKSSKIHFGKRSIVSGPKVVSTPIITSKTMKTLYLLTLEALSVGKDRIKVVNSPSDIGNIIIDSGTTLTYLPPSAYTKFESLVKKAMGNKTVEDPIETLNLCYRVSDKPAFPTITAHFTDANIELKPINTFVETGDDVTCLAFTHSGITDFGIFGNIAQINYKVGYDLVKKTVSFKPTVCGSLQHS